MKKTLINGALFTIVLLSLAACGGTTNKTMTSNSDKNDKSELAEKQEFTLLLQAELPSIDPSLQTDVIGYGAVKNTSEGLFSLDKDGKPILAGAEKEPEISEDGKTYTFSLRPEAKWSDGKPVTANDYVFAWQRTTDPKTAAEFAYLYAPIKNYSVIANGEKPVTELGIKAVNDYELTIELEQPVPYFEAMLTLPTFFPQSQEAVEKFGDKAYSSSETAVYNGAFVLNNFDGPGTDTAWTYEKNPNYWNQNNVIMNKINVNVVKESGTALNLFESGQADDIIISGEQAQQMQNEPTYMTQLQASMMWLQFNQTKKEFQNANLRKAISAAIDREALCRSILGNGSIPATNLVPESMSKNPKTGKDFSKEAGNHLPYDKKAAEEYWKLAQKELGMNQLTIEILCSDADSSKRVVEYLQGTIETTLSGIKVKVAPVPFSVRLDRSTKQDFDLVLGGWSALYPDPSNFTDLFTSANSNNNGSYNNPDYDKAVEQSNTVNALSKEKRWTDLQTANQIIMEDMGIAPLYQSAEAHLRNTSLKGIIPAMAQFDYKYSYKIK